ncbi:MAG: peptidoglycan-binding protein [Oscillospiraceae bacterium]|jgi:ABC-type Fe3+-hydroxamate transport system substrate-binding protein|nr:peptidoglycan-binding protein [Oscillospiraceae bacterium]
MLKKYTAALLCAVFVFSFLIGCGPKNDISSGVGAKDFPATVEKVTISNEPTGVAVLSPNLADVVLALGYEIKLKAKSTGCTQSDLAALPDVTADDADKIKGCGANLVLSDTALTQAQQSAMDKAGITVLVISPAADRADFPRLYSAVGAALKGAVTGYEKGKKIAAGIFETIDDITRAIPSSNTPVTAVYLYDTDGNAATGDTVAGSLVKAAGLQNVAAGATKGKYAVRDLQLANPDYIFCAKGVKAKILASETLKQLSAVKKNKIYEMDPNKMKLQGEEMVEAVSFMAGTAYPQLLQGTASSAAPSSPSSAASSPASSSPSSSSASSAVSSNSLNLNQTLKPGMQSDDILKMQNRLLELGYMFVKPSGLFAEGTEQSVKDFQLLNGLPATGIADPVTLQKMFSSDAKKRTG